MVELIFKLSKIDACLVSLILTWFNLYSIIVLTFLDVLRVKSFWYAIGKNSSLTMIRDRAL